MRPSRPFLLAALLVLLLALFLAAGCGNEDSSSGPGSKDRKGSGSGDTPRPLKAGGTFTFCTDVPYPPAESLEGSTFVGYEVDIAKEVADRLDTTAEFEKTLFDAIIPSLNSKKCDAIISSMNVTPEREKQVKFIEYLRVGQSLMTAPDLADEVQSLDDLSGRTVAVQVGTTLKDAVEKQSAKLEKDGKDPIEVKTFPDGGSAAAALKSDKVDAFFADSPVVAEYVNQDPDTFAFAGEPIDPLPVGIAVRTSDTDLAEAVQGAMDDMYEDGGMAKILEHWKIEDFGLDAG